jgi:hypothetical protein
MRKPKKKKKRHAKKPSDRSTSKKQTHAPNHTRRDKPQSFGCDPSLLPPTSEGTDESEEEHKTNKRQREIAEQQVTINNLKRRGDTIAPRKIATRENLPRRRKLPLKLPLLHASKLFPISTRSHRSPKRKSLPQLLPHSTVMHHMSSNKMSKSNSTKSNRNLKKMTRIAFSNPPTSTK